MADTPKELLYIADPMCSWCWGFAPVIASIREQYGDDLQTTLIVGGLRVGTKEPLADGMKQTVLHHWHEVHKATGQEFSFDFDVPEDFRYDTEPSCRAAVTVRALNPEAVFSYFDALHHAFYVGNRDVTDPEILAELAGPFGVERDVFLEMFNAKATKQETYDDFSRSFGFGVQGFPTVILQDARGASLLTTGYQHEERLVPLIEEWLVQGREAANS